MTKQYQYKGKYPNRIKTIWRNNVTGKWNVKTNFLDVYEVNFTQIHNMKTLNELVSLDLKGENKFYFDNLDNGYNATFEYSHQSDYRY